MSRPKEFDRAEALAAARVLFWKKGYEATTTDDLRHAMNIGRQSLYDSFGGKRPLYLEVLQRYFVMAKCFSVYTPLGSAPGPGY
jgi:TetR/AcrR family transcriptional regulator, transcriptional repressor for nem operon